MIVSCYYFQTNYDSLHPAIDALIAASNAMLESKSLNGFLRFSLQTGNFINAVGYGINVFVSPRVRACVCVCVGGECVHRRAYMYCGSACVRA